MAKIDEKNWGVERYQLKASSTGKFEKVFSLPKDVTLWRIHSLGEQDIQWGPDIGENPRTNEGSDAILVLHGKSADVPPFIPATLKCRREIQIWARQTASENPYIEIVWTTSEDPRVMAAMAMGLAVGDIEIGKVEIKDTSGNVTAQVTSGVDGVQRLEVSISGQSVNVSGVIVVVSGSVVAVIRAQSVLSGNLYTSDLNLTAGQVLTSQSTVVTVASQDAVGIQGVAIGQSSNASGEVIFYWGKSLDGTNFDGVNNMSNAIAMTCYLNGGNTVYKAATVDVRGMNAIRCVGIENKAGVALSGVNVRVAFGTRQS